MSCDPRDHSTWKITRTIIGQLLTCHHLPTKNHTVLMMRTGNVITEQSLIEVRVPWSEQQTGAALMGSVLQLGRSTHGRGLQPMIFDVSGCSTWTRRDTTVITAWVTTELDAARRRRRAAVSGLKSARSAASPHFRQHNRRPDALQYCILTSSESKSSQFAIA